MSASETLPGTPATAGKHTPGVFVGEKPMGGFFALDGVPALWNGYVSVPDVDQAVAKVTPGGVISVFQPNQEA